MGPQPSPPNQSPPNQPYAKPREPQPRHPYAKDPKHAAPAGVTHAPAPRPPAPPEPDDLGAPHDPADPATFKRLREEHPDPPGPRPDEEDVRDDRKLLEHLHDPDDPSVRARAQHAREPVWPHDARSEAGLCRSERLEIEPAGADQHPEPNAAETMMRHPEHAMPEPLQKPEAHHAEHAEDKHRRLEAEAGGRRVPRVGQRVRYRGRAIEDVDDQEHRTYLALVLAVHSLTRVDLHVFYGGGPDDHTRKNVEFGEGAGWSWAEDEQGNALPEERAKAKGKAKVHEHEADAAHNR